MADAAYRQFLKQLEEEAKAKQRAFMERIASNMKRPRTAEAPPHPFRGAPDFWRTYELPPDERIGRFTANFTAAGGHVVRLADLGEARRFVGEQARDLRAERLIRQNDPLLDELNLESELPEASVIVWGSDSPRNLKAGAAEADIGVVAADHAVAHTGSLAVQSSPDKGRSVSLLPTALFAIVPVDRLATRLGEVLARFDEEGRERLPAGIHFISGPSRSADIENDLTIGVHGPGVVFALLVG